MIAGIEPLSLVLDRFTYSTTLPRRSLRRGLSSPGPSCLEVRALPFLVFAMAA